MDFKFKKSLIFGVGAGIALLGLYFLVLSLANSFSHAIEQFLEMWYWILLLVIGFGIQVGLYAFIRERQKVVSGTGKVLAVSGGVSTGSMIICCLHHLVDVLPLLGIAALAVFLVQYQVFFIIFGILANLIGIIIMLEIIKKHQYIGLFKKITIGASLPVLLITFLLINNQPDPRYAGGFGEARTTVSAMDLPSRVDSQSGVTFKVNPVEFNLADPVRFEIEVDTHSGSLDFDLTKISILEDDNGNKYQPLEWSGSGIGGHHLSGVLTFPGLKDQTKKIKLIISDISQRVFDWELK